MSAQTAYSFSAVTPHDSTNIATGVCDERWPEFTPPTLSECQEFCAKAVIFTNGTE